MESEFAVELPETVVFDYPTATALSTFILERGEGDGDASASSDSDAEAAFADRHRRSRRRSRRKRRSSRDAEVAAAATRERVLAVIGGLLGREVAPDEPLMDAGLDSLSGVELKQQMESEFAVELPETVVFDYPRPPRSRRSWRNGAGRAAAATKTPIRMCVRRLRTRRRCIARGHAAADDRATRVRVV